MAGVAKLQPARLAKLSAGELLEACSFVRLQQAQPLWPMPCAYSSSADDATLLLVHLRAIKRVSVWFSW